MYLILFERNKLTKRDKVLPMVDSYSYQSKRSFREGYPNVLLDHISDNDNVPFLDFHFIPTSTGDCRRPETSTTE